VREGAGRGRTPALQRWSNHVATALLSISGVALFVFRSVLEPPADDPFAVASHPWEPHALTLHVLAAPLGVLALGMLVTHHVVPRLRDRGFKRSRRSGILLSVTAVPMIASAYLLQVSVAEGWRRAWLLTHLATSAAWMIGWLLHLLSARRSRAGSLAWAARPGGAGGRVVSSGASPGSPK
jgi:hypothetical protein